MNPLLSLSVDEIADMDREVEDILQDSDGGESDEEEPFELVAEPNDNERDVEGMETIRRTNYHNYF